LLVTPPKLNVRAVAFMRALWALAGVLLYAAVFLQLQTGDSVTVPDRTVSW